MHSIIAVIIFNNFSFFDKQKIHFLNQNHQGQLYDEHGELRNWWTNQTRKLFAEKADCFVDQYSNFSINSAKVNYLVDVIIKC